MTQGQPIRLMIHGARGKMGARIVALAREDRRFNIVAAHDLDDSAQADQIAAGGIEALVDFSSDQGAARAAALALKHGAALLVGTTGLSRNSLDAIEVSARSIPAIIAPNTSRGVAVLNHLVAEAARLLGAEFDIDLVESHHALKRDAPSGTALRIVQTLRQKAGRELPAQRVHSLRSGDIIGEHSVTFAGPGEIVKIFHFATNRDLFARGALEAVAWLTGKPAGLYTIEQSLGVP